MVLARIYMNLAYALSEFDLKWYVSIMMKFIIGLFILNMQISLVVAHEMKPLDKYLTKKDTDFKEVTVRKALEDIFEQMDNPCSLLLPANDPELVEAFEGAKITLKLKAGIPYEELTRQVLLCGGFSYKYDGEIWRVLNRDQACIDLADFWTKTYRLTKKELSALGLLDDLGDVDMVAMRRWLNVDGEAFGHQKGGKILVIRALKNKMEALNSLLSLHRLGYEIPTLYSKIKE
jgi:hypothetical protein